MKLKREEPKRTNIFDEKKAQNSLLFPPTTGSLKAMEEFKNDYKYSKWHQQVTDTKLCVLFSHYRSIRGDGNCGYRAVYVLYIELLISLGPAKIKAFVKNLISNQGLMKWAPVFEINYKFKIIDYLTQLTKEKEKRAALRLFNLMINSDREFDEVRQTDLQQGLILVLRFMVTNLLLMYPEIKIHDLPISQVFDRNEYRDLNDYIERSILVLGEESQDLVLYLLPIVLRIQIKTMLMDRNAGNGGLIVETKAPYIDNKATKIYLNDELDLHDYSIYLFLRPGHYDALYPIEFIENNPEFLNIEIEPKKIREYEDIRPRKYHTFDNVVQRRSQTPEFGSRFRKVKSENFENIVRLTCGCKIKKFELAFQLREYQQYGKSLGLKGPYSYLRFNDAK